MSVAVGPDRHVLVQQAGTICYVSSAYVIIIIIIIIIIYSCLEL